MAANNETQMVLGHDNTIIVSNGQQPPVTSASFIRLSLKKAVSTIALLLLCESAESAT